MPEYDENFLLDCSNFEKQRWKSYNFKFKLKPLDTNSNYLPISSSSSNVKYSPLKGIDSLVADAGPNGDYRHSVFGYPPSPSSPSQVVINGLTMTTPTMKHCESGTITPSSHFHGDAKFGTSGHKGSLRGTKLARRARSFKDDFLEKISQIRTPTNTMTRSHSPNSPRGRTPSKGNNDVDTVKSNKDLNYYVKMVKNALQYFKSVISTNKLEMLAGNGTIVLEQVAQLHTALQSYALNEYSSALISATTQVYDALGKLIKLCDDVILSDDEKNCVALSQDNVDTVVKQVEQAVQHLADLANEKLTEPAPLKNGGSPAHVQKTTTNTLQRPVIDAAAQRTSLPDISLTPRERDQLEQVSIGARPSFSSENLLCDASPPPKPPLPNRHTDPPPLPPKRRPSTSQTKSPTVVTATTNNELDSNTPDSANFLQCGTTLDRNSIRSRSPEDNSSLLSASAGSLDSALNHSREEEELKQLTLDTSVDENHLCSDIGLIKQSVSHENNWDEAESVQHNTEATNHRNSDESGFVSFRSSTQSVIAKHVSASFTQKSISNVISKFDAITEQNSKFSSATSSVENMYEGRQMSSVSSSIIAREVSDQIEAMNASLDDVFGGITDEKPPLPEKNRKSSIRRVSTYDNVDETDATELRNHFSNLTRFNNVSGMPSKCFSVIETRQLQNHAASIDGEEKPPLPPKKNKHIMAYMEIFGNCSQNNNEFLRYSVPAYPLSQTAEHLSSQSFALSAGSTSMHSSTSSSISHSHTMSLAAVASATSSTTSSSTTVSIKPAMPSPAPSPTHQLPTMVKPPALPPKSIRTGHRVVPTPPSSPKIVEEDPQPTVIAVSPTITLKVSSPAAHERDEYEHLCDASSASPLPNLSPSNSVVVTNHNTTSSVTNNGEDEEQVVLRRNLPREKVNGTIVHPTDAAPSVNLLEHVDVSKFLVFKKDGEDGPDIKGGNLDALIIHATKVTKKSDAYGEAFLTTYRTFITPDDLFEKLTYRYTHFTRQKQDQKQRAAKESFSLLVRVVSDLTVPDLSPQFLKTLTNFQQQLICDGELQVARVLRIKVIEKVKLFKSKCDQVALLPAQPIMTALPALLDLKSYDIAAQMTFLDADLFQKIEIPEVLLWAKDQNEDKTPNLTHFTEHFNKMSFWARTVILKQEDAKDREKHVIKFIKIMKHLRKMNNYNSYLAILSALDSAPIRRLEWHKSITEGLKEYCALIDSSSSFRAYRLALSETNPPCIPYIGLVLQDLTFVHIGNPDYLPDGSINFMKRWQQYNIVVNMKRFKQCAYSFTKNERIIGFFNNFEDCLDDEVMWQISESIKPRKGKNLNNINILTNT